MISKDKIGDRGATDLVVAEWRADLQRDVSESRQVDGSIDPRLVERRHYGRYLYVAIDWVLALVLGQFIFAIPLLFVTAVIHFASSGQSATQSSIAAYLRQFASNPPPIFNIAGFVTVDGSLILVLWLRLRQQKRGWDLFGLGTPLRRNAASAIATGLAVGVAALILSSIIGVVQDVTGFNNFLVKHHLGDPNAQAKALTDPLKKAPVWVVVATVLIGTFLAPAVEELFFRGYIFRAVASRKTLLAAYLTSALTFAAAHLLVDQFLPLFAIGLLLCFAYQRTGNLLANFTAHAFNNGVAFTLFLISLLPHVH